MLLADETPNSPAIPPPLCSHSVSAMVVVSIGGVVQGGGGDGGGGWWFVSEEEEGDWEVIYRRNRACKDGEGLLKLGLM
ncbi:hypothetical protein L6452_33889 [Arctium lappa]|uniref:Uncharacterized protein n=1 Tax=Arctium lappa TaxID=4217 RepID=A0ACB8YH98_ARCLA|nr:hypothetical protein L6452_33889 [Arctium lappa]